MQETSRLYRDPKTNELVTAVKDEQQGIGVMEMGPNGKATFVPRPDLVPHTESTATPTNPLSIGDRKGAVDPELMEKYNAARKVVGIAADITDNLRVDSIALSTSVPAHLFTLFNTEWQALMKDKASQLKFIQDKIGAITGEAKISPEQLDKIKSDLPSIFDGSWESVGDDKDDQALHIQNKLGEIMDKHGVDIKPNTVLDDKIAKLIPNYGAPGNTPEQNRNLLIQELSKNLDTSGISSTQMDDLNRRMGELASNRLMLAYAKVSMERGGKRFALQELQNALDLFSGRNIPRMLSAINTAKQGANEEMRKTVKSMAAQFWLSSTQNDPQYNNVTQPEILNAFRGTPRRNPNDNSWGMVISKEHRDKFGGHNFVSISEDGGISYLTIQRSDLE